MSHLRPYAEECASIRSHDVTFVALCGETRLDSAARGDVCGFVRRNASRLGCVSEVQE
jgi:hypothetical protein